MLAVAVLLIVAGALGGMQLLTASNSKISVLVLVKSVPAGHVIAAADLGTASLSGKIAYTPASAEPDVVGKTAARDLFAGQLLTHSMMSSTSVPDAAHALVGLQLKAGQLPSAGLADGDTVELVNVPSSNGAPPVTASGAAAGDKSGPSSAATLATGTVYAVAPDANSSGGALVTVLVPRQQSQALTIAASSGQVALIRVGS